MTKTYKLFGTLSQDNAGSLDITDPGAITAIEWAADASGGADGANMQAQVSFGSTSSFTSNDSRADMSEIRLIQEGTAANNQVNKTISGLDVPVEAGERVFLHVSFATFSSVRVACYLHVMQAANAPRAAARRR